MNRIEASQPDREEQLVDKIFVIIWANQVFAEYNNLPKGNSRERRQVREFVTRTATHLLQSPKDINIADDAWRTNRAEQDGQQESQEPFSELVRKERLALIKEKWKDTTPGQLAQLVRIYADSNDPSQDDAKEMLTNYFRGPKSRHQRIDAYYNFVSATLDLVGEEEAFKEGMKISLHSTDILPKDPSLVEQVVLLSLPCGEVESVFKKLLIARSVIAKVRFMGSWDIAKYYEEMGNFIRTNSVVIDERDKRQRSVIKQIGKDKVREMNKAMIAAMRVISDASKEPLSKERKQRLKNIWPYNLAFDENDSLNQKFEKVQLQLRSDA